MDMLKQIYDIGIIPVIKINDAASVQAAKDSIDIVVNTINEEKEYKKQLAKERRKAARLAKANKA